MRKRQTALALFVTLAVMVVQIAGPHFHVHESAVVHAEHSDTHHSSHENTAAIDLPVVGFWKSADQGSNFFALLTVAFALLLVTRSRLVLRTRPETRPRFDRSVFLRPPLRAPPR